MSEVPRDQLCGVRLAHGGWCALEALHAGDHEGYPRKKLLGLWSSLGGIVRRFRSPALGERR